LDERIKPDLTILGGGDSKIGKAATRNQNNQDAYGRNALAAEVLHHPWHKQIELFFDRDTPQWNSRIRYAIRRTGNTVKRNLPCAHEKKKTEKGVGFRWVSVQERKEESQADSKVIQGPDAQDATNIELLDVDRTTRLSLPQQKFADEKGT
jgi:hypothetical protein